MTNKTRYKKVRFRNSGIHTKTQFFTCCENIFADCPNPAEAITYNKKLMRKLYAESITWSTGKKRKVEDLTKEEIEMVDARVKSVILDCRHHYQIDNNDYDEKIAAKCGIYAFRFNNKSFLRNSTIHELEIYQFLVDNTIDKDGYLAQKKRKEYFVGSVGEELTNAVWSTLAKYKTSITA